VNTGMLYVGTAGTSVWFSGDFGEIWVRPNSSSGLYLESRIWSITSHPSDPDHLTVGTDRGVYRWSESEQHWTHLPSPMDGKLVWAISQSPDDPDYFVAGTCPASLWYSSDGAKTWTQGKTSEPMNDFSGVNSGPTRVTQILFDPIDKGTVWATVEIDSIYRSADEGRTWTKLEKGLISGDVHGIAVSASPQGKVLLCTTNKGLHRSTDNGETWVMEPLDYPFQYCRAVQLSADSKNIFLCNGNGPPGSTGRLLRSHDAGNNWEDVHLPGDLNSTPWCVATNEGDPSLLFAVTNLGQLFKSTDAGTSWKKLRREFGEVRSIHWRPVTAPERLVEAWMRDGRPW
jgi:photosystem II stability/assembly factor-like uncharacterized protein